MNRRDFIKTLGAIGVVSALPIAIAEAKEYPDIKYEKTFRPEMLAYQHIVYGSKNDETWIVTELSDGEILPDSMFESMVRKLNQKLMV